KGTKKSMVTDSDGGPLGVVIAGANILERRLLEAPIESIVVERPEPTKAEPQHQRSRITIANMGYMGSFVSRANPDFCRTVLRLSDSVVTNTAHFYSRNIIRISCIFHENPRKPREKWCVSPASPSATRASITTGHVAKWS